MSWYIFVYDHTVLKGDEETDPDPFEAIRLFYPPTTNIQRQHELCSQLMGVNKFMDQLLHFKPKIFHLGSDEERVRVACIHSPCGRFTFAYGSSNLSLSGDCVYRHATIIYDLIACYYGCLTCVFSEDAPVDRSVDLVSSVARFQTAVTYSDKTLPAIFQPIPHQSLVDSFTYQHVTVFLENLSNYEHVVGGCIIYNKALLASYLPTKIASKFLLIKSYYIEASKKLPDFLKSSVCDIPLKHDNVKILKCYFTAEDFGEMKKKKFFNHHESLINKNTSFCYGQTNNQQDVPMENSECTTNGTKSCCTSCGYQMHFAMVLNLLPSNLILIVLLKQSIHKYYNNESSSCSAEFSDYIHDLVTFATPSIHKIDHMLSAVSNSQGDQQLEMDHTLPPDALVFDYVDHSLTVNNINDKGGNISDDKGCITVLSYSQMQLDEAVGGLHDKFIADRSLESIAVVSKDIGCLRARRRDGNKEVYEIIGDDK